MTTFLQLCQDVALESGTVPGSGKPETVTDQTERLGRIVGWVARAYRNIQNAERYWKWLEDTVTKNLTEGVDEYSASALGLTRFSHWLPERPGAQATFTLYETSVGQADEGHLRYVPWGDFQPIYDVGSNASQTGKPTIFTITPANAVQVYPIPDNTGFTMRARYYKSDQALAADDDVPEMPAHFHDAIMYKALEYLCIFDEESEKRLTWHNEYQRVMSNLRGDQLPQIKLGGPLA